mgnify:CR=1 FL=1
MKTKRHTLHVPSNLQIMLGIDQVREIPAEPWTAARVKAEHPDVTVRHADQEYRGRVTGSGDYAHVTIWRSAQDWQSWEWSWPAIARHLNSGRPLAT